MNTRKITIIIIFIFFLIDKYIDGVKTNYEAWIVIFLFWIAYNTSKLEDN